MAISNRVTKILWAKAGGICSFPGCQRRLVENATELDGDVVLGEAAHIVARSKDGPRGRHTVPGNDVDSHENLILLCEQHHRIIDAQPNTYSVTRLLEMKEKHERWVRQRLSEDMPLPPAIAPRADERETGKTLQVFVCHSSNDKLAVRDLCQRLRSEGFDPWLDEEKLLPGEEWRLVIPRTVRTSHAVIVCLSRNAVSKAGYVQKEIRCALDAADEQPEGAIFIIPVRLEECDVPDRLRRWQWVDLYEESGFERLVLALRARDDALGKHLDD